MIAFAIVAQMGRISRSAKARQLMGYSGLVPNEDSSGERERRRAIAKTVNAHLRRVLVEAVRRIVTAVGRESPGFVRAIGAYVETRMREPEQVAGLSQRTTGGRQCRCVEPNTESRVLVRSMRQALWAQPALLV